MSNTPNYKAWIAKGAKQPMVLEAVNLGPLGDEEVEVAVEHCGLCHSDLSVIEQRMGQFAIPGDSRSRGHRPGHGRRSEYQGTQRRTARRRRLELG